MRTTLMAVSTLCIFAAACSGADAEAPAVTPPTSTSTTSTITETTATAISSTTSSLPTFEEVFESGEVHQMSPEEAAGFFYVLAVSDYFEDREPNVFLNLLVEQEDEFVDALIALGSRLCDTVRMDHQDGLPPVVAAAGILRGMHESDPGAQLRELDLVALDSALTELCPDVLDWFREGLNSLPVVIPTDRPFTPESVEALEFLVDLGIELQGRDVSDAMPIWNDRFDSDIEGSVALVKTARDYCATFSDLYAGGTPAEDVIAAAASLVFETYDETDPTIDLILGLQFAAVRTICSDLSQWFAEGLEALNAGL